MENTETEKRRFWGLLELMGHARIAGELTEEALGGTTLIRVDVPEVPEQEMRRYGVQHTLPAVPGFTKYFGGSAVYSITPLTEQACRCVMAQLRTDPVQHVDLTVAAVEVPRLIDAATTKEADDDYPF